MRGRNHATVVCCNLVDYTLVHLNLYLNLIIWVYYSTNTLSIQRLIIGLPVSLVLLLTQNTGISSFLLHFALNGKRSVACDL